LASSNPLGNGASSTTQHEAADDEGDDEGQGAHSLGVSAFGRIDKVRAEKESLSGFIRKAVEHEIQRREAERKKRK
jgi:hypothetical protein